MTNKQAILQLQNLREHCNSSRAIEGIWEDDMQALDLAIKALGGDTKPKRWRAEKNSSYWYVSDYGAVVSVIEYETDINDYHYYSPGQKGLAVRCGGSTGM